MHKKYTYKDGKKYGPYLYETKRVNGKIVTRYLGQGSSAKKINGKNLFYAFLGIALLVLLLYFVINYSGITGNVSLDIKSKFSPGEQITGNLIIKLNHGELIPSDSKVYVTFNGEEKELLLSDIVSDELIEGEYYLVEKGVSGFGQGFGVYGEKTEYPELDFSFKIVDLEDSQPNESNEETLDENDSQDTDLVQQDVEETVNESPNQDSEQSTPEETDDSSEESTDNSGESSEASDQSETSTEASSTESTSESSSGDSSSSDSSSSSSSDSGSSDSGSSDSGSGGITGAVISGDEISAKVSKSNPYTYSFDQGKIAEVVSGSVSYEGNVLDDSEVSVNNGKKKATFKTNYAVVSQGFGEDYIKNKKYNLKINLKNFDFKAENSGDMIIRVEYSGSEIAQLTEDISVEQTEESLEDNLDEDLNDIIDENSSENEMVESNLTLNNTIGSNLTLNETLEGNLTVNDTISNETSLEVNITQEPARIGEPVKWVKRLDVNGPASLIVEIPESAENVSVIKDGKEEKAENKIVKDEDADSENLRVGLTGQVSADIELDNDSGVARFFKNMFRFSGFAVQEEENFQEVSVDVTGDEEYVEVVYYTPAPYSIEQDIEGGKRVEVIGPADVHYENIEAYTNLPEEFNLVNPARLKIRWVEEQTYLDLNEIIDSDGNGVYDYVSWIVPHLSNQTFELVILVTEAEHLDENKEFISDIYDNVSQLDGIWSEEINHRDYVRVRFERNLSNGNDIRVFSRIVSGNPSIEVYQFNDSQLLGEVSVVDGNYSILLIEGLNDTQDRFDLRIVGGRIEIDHIIDPTELAYSGFESGEQGWTFGGLADSERDSTRSVCDDSGDCASTGSWSGHLQDDAAGSYFERSFDFASYDSVNVSFWYYPESVDTSEYVQLFCDSTEIWRFTAGDHAQDSWSFTSALISTSDCTFDSSVILQFTGNPGLSGNADDLWVDGINVTAYEPSTLVTVNATINNIDGDTFNSTVVISYANNGTVVYNQTGVVQNETALPSEETYDAVILPIEVSAIEKVTFNEINLTNYAGSTTVLLQMNDLNDNSGFEEVFVIDPIIGDFSNISVNISLNNSALYGCEDWNISSQGCDINWSLLTYSENPSSTQVTLTSNGTYAYGIIPISNALHLDSNRSFISNIYENVSQLDGIWSEEIPANDYVRVTFVENLTSINDITIYARITGGNPVIDVFEKDDNVSLAFFGNITNDTYQKIYLTNLSGIQDTFDLHVLNGSLEFDHIIDPQQPISGANTGLGMLSYLRTNNRPIPRYRVYNLTSGLFGDELNATTTGVNLEHIWVKCAPNRYECALLTADTSDDLKIQFYSYNSTGGLCWNNGSACGQVATLGTTLIGTNGEKAGLEYENSSGELLIVWNNNSEDSLLYSVWNGTSFTVNSQLVGVNLVTSGAPVWIETAQQPNTDNIALVYATNATHGGGFIWNGSSNSFACEIVNGLDTVAFTSVAIGGKRPAIDVAFEQVSGDMFAIFGLNTNTEFSYATKSASACSYSIATTTTLEEQSDSARLTPSWTSNAIVVTTKANSGEDAEWVLWSGTALSTNDPGDTNTAADAAGNEQITSACLRNSDRCIMVYADAGTTDGGETSINWEIVNTTTDTWVAQADVPVTLSATLEALRCYSYPIGPYVDDKILCVLEDDSDDLWAYLYDDSASSWSYTNQTAEAIAIDTTVAEYRSFAFDFVYSNATLYSPPADTTPPQVTINLPTNVTYTNFPIYFNVTLSESGNVNYTLNGGTTNFTMSSTDGLSFNATNTSMAEGSYTFRAYARDSAGNANFTTSVVFSVNYTNNLTFELVEIEKGTASAGADGTHLADINGDGCQDIVTGWEQSGYARVYLASRSGIYCNGEFTVLNVSNTDNYNVIEDSRFVDLNNDSLYDVVLAREVNGREITVFWANSTTTWEPGQNISNASQQANWMKINNGDFDNDGDMDLVVCSKSGSSPPENHVRLLSNPGGNSSQQMNLSNWEGFEIAPASFCMSLIVEDFDNDGDLDLAYSDRNRGLEWRDNPSVQGGNVNATWTSRRITPLNQPGGELRFCDYADLDNDTTNDIVCGLSDETASPPFVAAWFKNPGPALANDTNSWIRYNISINDVGVTGLNQSWSKSAVVGDLDQDGKADIAVAQADVTVGHTFYWIKQPSNISSYWNAYLINYTDGTKYDEIQILDLDTDNDLDIITSEEHEYGVLYYENNLNLSTFETTPPQVTINLPTNTTYSLPPILFNVSLNENGTVSYTLNEGITNYSMSPAYGMSFNASNDSIASGSYIFRVYAEDLTGNKNYTESVTFSIAVVDVCDGPVIGEDWIIPSNTNCTFVGANLSLSADKSVLIYGNLTLIGSNLFLDPSSDGAANISVYSGGIFNVTSASKINSTSTSSEYFFEASSGSSLYITHSTIVDAGGTGSSGCYRGICSTSTNVVISNNTISGGYYAAYFDTGSDNSQFIGNDVSGWSQGVIYVYANNVNISDNSFTGTMGNIQLIRMVTGADNFNLGRNNFTITPAGASVTDAVFFDENAQNASVYENHFVYQSGTEKAVIGTDSICTGCRFVRNNFDWNVGPAFNLYASNPFVNSIFEDNIFNSTNGNNQYLNASSAYTGNLSFLNSTGLNSSMVYIQSGLTGTINLDWRVDVNVSDTSGALENANVSLFNNTLGLLFNELTSANGFVSQHNVTSDYINSTSSYTRNPHTLNVSLSGYGDYSNSSVNITQSVRLDVLLSTANTITNPTPEINSTDGSNRTLQDLNCFDALTDTESNTLNVSVRWYNKGTLQLETDYNASYSSGSFFDAVLDSGNTTKGDTWFCSMRTFDGIGYSEWVNSSSLTILNTPPTVTLSSPADSSSTTDRTPTFVWTSNDDDQDTLSYYLNITCQTACPLTDDRFISGIVGTSHEIVGDLQNLYDNGFYYNWTVFATDSESNGTSPNMRRINITSLVQISLPNNSVEFGQLPFGGNNDTTDDSPRPFLIQNDGNSFVNITIGASSLWQSVENPNSYYRFKVDNNTLENGSFNWGLSVTSFTDMPLTASPALCLAVLNYTNSTDSAEIDIYVEMPPSEGASANPSLNVRNSTVTFTASLGE